MGSQVVLMLLLVRGKSHFVVWSTSLGVYFLKRHFNVGLALAFKKRKYLLVPYREVVP